MRLAGRLRKQTDVDIKDYYALKVGAMWRGLKQESVAFWCLCFYLFFEYVRPQSIYPVIDILPWAQGFLLFALVTMRSDASVRWVKSGGNVLILLFFALVFLSSAFAFRPSVSWEKIDIVFNWIVIYFLVITIINTERRFFIFALLFLLVNFKMSQHGALSFALRGFSFARWGVSGSPGWFQNAGDFGLQMTIFVPLAMAFIYALKSYWGRITKLLLYLLPLTGLITIVATSSRGAQLGIAGVAIWFLLKSRLGFKALIAILVVGWSLYQILPEKMLEKYETSGEDKTSQARLIYWDYGIDVALDNPVFGVGYENWRHYCWFKRPNGVAPGVGCLDPHNSLVETAAEIGIPALILYLSIVLYIFITNARTRKQAMVGGNNFIFYMAHGLDGGLVGYFIASFFLTVTFYPMIWIQLAMAVALHQIIKVKVIEKSNTVRSEGVSQQRLSISGK